MNFYNNRGFYQLRGHIEDDKDHYFNRIHQLYMNLYNLDVNIRRMPSTGVVGFQIWSDDLVKFKNQYLKLPLGRKDNIKLPGWIHSKSLFFSFLRGLFDTDGCLYLEKRKNGPYPRIEIKLTSEPLWRSIVHLLQKFDFPVKFFKLKRNEKNWNTLYTVRLNGFTSLKKWHVSIGSNNPKHSKKFELLI